MSTQGVLDLETRSECDLKKVGGKVYAEHPTTEILCAAVYVDGVVHVWTPYGTLYEMQLLGLHVEYATDVVLQPTLAHFLEAVPATVIAHNAEAFDRIVWESQGLPERTWIDSLPLARRCGLPGRLDTLGQELFGKGKGKGKSAMDLLSRPRKGRMVPVTQQPLSLCAQYCIEDVELLARVWSTELQRKFPEWENEFLAASQVIDRRGFVFDTELAGKLLIVEQQERAREAAIVERVTEGEVTADMLTSEKKLLKWLRSKNYYLPNAQAVTCLAVIQHPDCLPVIRTVLWARLNATRIASGKLTRGINMQDAEGRLKYQLAYYAGHTGRAGGRGIQPQNLPRSHEIPNDTANRIVAGELDRARQVAVEAVKDLSVVDVISTLVRECIVPSPGHMLAIADYSAIEGRGVCWAADDYAGLQVYRDGRDPYIDTAAKMYGLAYDDIAAAYKAGDETASKQRAVGKSQTLGCGYQMGKDRFDGFATAMGIDLAAAGVTAQHAIEAWRDAHPAIAGTRLNKQYEGVELRTGGLWKELHLGVKQVVEGARAWLRAGKCFWQMEEKHLICTLPSGRPMIYRNTRIEPVVPSWGGDPRPTVTFDHVSQGSSHRAALYGGKLTENIVQALCRDLLAHAIVACEKAGMRTVLHVHDEIVAEVHIDCAENGLNRLCDIMCEPPSWARGFPLKVAGFLCHRYTKNEPQGAYRYKTSRELSV